MKKFWRGTEAVPRDILYSSIKSALFLLSSSVHNFNFFNLVLVLPVLDTTGRYNVKEAIDIHVEDSNVLGLICGYNVVWLSPQARPPRRFWLQDGTV